MRDALVVLAARVTGRAVLGDPSISRGCARSKPLCVKGPFRGASRQRRGRGRSWWSGPGVTVPKCRCSGFSRPRWIEESSLVVLPGPLSAAAEVDLELVPDGVAEATLQSSQCLLLRLPLGDLALVVDPAGCVVADLGIAPRGPTNSRPLVPASDHSVRSPARSGTIARGITTTRTPAFDFGRPVSNCPLISASLALTVTSPCCRSACRRRSAISLTPAAGRAPG